jgi:hypothetical protein
MPPTSARPAPLFAAPDTLIAVAYDPDGLTYQSNDLGPEDYVWPSPVWIRPDGSVWAAVEAPGRPAWRLLRLASTGPAVTQNLADILDLKTPGEFMPVALGEGTDDGLHLLAARRFDARTQRYRDFALTRFTTDGTPVETSSLSETFAYSGTAYLTGNGEVINYEEDRPDAAWYRYSPSGTRSHWVDTVPGMPSAAVAAGVLERLGTAFRLLGGDGSVTPVPLEGDVPTAAAYTGGEGEFFGCVTTGPYSADATGKANKDPADAPTSELGELGEWGPGSVTQARTLHVLRYDSARGVVSLLGTADLSPARFSEDDRRFRIFRPDQGRFDAEGNYLEVAWTDRRMLLLRYPLDRNATGRPEPGAGE